jgi:serine/threonine protein phosphatase 1
VFGRTDRQEGDRQEGGRQDDGAPPCLALPARMRAYAVGDVHGQLHLLDELLARVDADVAAGAPDEVVEVFLGDYVDRGPDSAGVIDRLCARAGREDGRRRIFLRGNHEIYFAEFLKDPAVLSDWARNGGVTTIGSYGVNPRPVPPDPEAIRESLAEKVPQRHRAFLDELEWMVRLGDVLFVHAGIRPGVPLEAQSAQDLVLIRHEFLEHDGPLPVRVVHGHTPVKAPVATPWRVSVDTGAFATGRLTAAVMEGSGVRFLQTGAP